MYFNEEKIDRIKNYIKKLSLRGNDAKIVKALLDYMESSYSDKSEKYEIIEKLLWDKNTKHINEVFSGNKSEILKNIFGDKNGATLKKIWDSATEYMYSKGYYRRSYRTNKNSNLYLSGNIDKMAEFLYLSAIDFSIEIYFEKNSSEYEYVSVISDIIAVEVDSNNQYIMEQVKEIIYSDNNNSVITRELIRGLLMSKNKEAHKMMGELLLAAKLQEGLRQSIVESLDEGSTDSMIYILKIIIENNLMRFSSVVRAFGTWTGMALDVEKLKVINKCFEAAYKCLIDSSYKNECLESSDNMLIYIGAWSTAFYEVEDITELLNNLLSSKETYKKQVALLFLYETKFNVFKHNTAVKLLDNTDMEIAVLVIKNLYSSINLYSLVNYQYEVEQYYRDKEIFNKLKKILDLMPKKEIEFNEIVFPWVNFTLSADEIIQNMMIATSISIDEEVVDTLIEYKDKMSVNTREYLIKLFLNEPKNTKQKLILLESCGDRSQSVREIAFEQVNKLNLRKDDYDIIENLLQYKSGDLRKSAIKLLLKQKSSELKESIKRMVTSKSENKQLAAIDIVSAIEVIPEHKDIFEESLKLINTMENISQKGEMLTQNIGKKNEDIKNFENGFGLYDKSKEYNVSPIEKPKNFNIKSLFSMSEDNFFEILNKFSDLINEYRDFEYEIVDWNESKIMITLGGSSYLNPFDKESHKLDNYPIADKVREFAKQNSLEGIKLIELNFYIKMSYELRYQSYLPWYKKWLEESYDYKILKESIKEIDKIAYIEKIKGYIELLHDEIEPKEKFEIGKLFSKYTYTSIPVKKYFEEYLDIDGYRYYYKSIGMISNNIINYWLYLMSNNMNDETEFSDYFYIAYNYYKASNYMAHSTLQIDDFGRALESGIIDENEVYLELMARNLSNENIRSITNQHKYNQKCHRESLFKYPKLIKIAEKAVEVITEIEVKRGELNSEVTHLASVINKCYGVNLFASIVLASEKDTYIRGYNFLSGDCTKKQMLSSLLKCCYPKEDENVETLKEYLKNKKVSSQQLIDAAMYSPQWLDIVSEYLGYEGLKSSCWYFHAHVNDYFSNEKESIIARYTPLSMADLRDGAFDQKWFEESYKTLGEKNFKLVYDSAKYIAAGGLHKRSQLFADATLGKLDAAEVKSRVMDKRNKDYLLTYGLIPVKDKKELLERYEYIHLYKKESKQFGSQRQASEARSADIALINLAGNAGYADVNRMTWDMETARVDMMKLYFLPQKVEDIELYLIIDEFGQTEIICLKDGKKLKNIPSKLNKHAYILELKELKKSLKEQYLRAKKSFETAMENEEKFKWEEIQNLAKNPVIFPIIKNLIFKSEEKFGYINGDSLENYKNEQYKLKNSDEVVIAHPIHLYEAKCWSDYQKDIFKKEIIQPFKQIFRELYKPNADELKELTLSRRYAGHQVQPKKTTALLKTRGWVVSNEEGIQKIYYKENIIATIYAVADWFSPSDIESPTLEFIRFEDRKTFKPVNIDKVSKVIFSEIMRDIDMVVSVAHVGGVDPEATLSTVEIRSVIVAEILRLKKLSNVILKGSHAYITGVHGEYTVHLGSGVVHKMGAGSINILAVHSSHRGKIFLPFIDSDPKSSEIISKIIFLAEDTKIKDPTVLEQIVN